jgi:outer membrane protein, multidrug efflux system
MTKRAVWTAAWVAAAVCAGCAVGPNYRAATPLPTPDYSGAERDTFAQDKPIPAFWTIFDDAALTDLVSEALRNNQDLHLAEAHLNEARALRSEAFYDFVPTVTANASYTEALQSADQFLDLPRAERKTALSSAGLDAFWELDFFGRVRRENESARAQEQALQADVHDAERSVAAEVARAYFEMRGAQQRLAVATRNADNQAQTLAYTEARVDAGRSTEFDTERAKAQLDATRAIIPTLRAAVAVDEHRIAVLLGRPPSDLRSVLDEPRPLPTLPRLVNIGEPQTLLRRRPDVRAAERRLASATADIGVATADYFPVVTFTGEAGFAVESLGSVGQPSAEYYTFGPSIHWAAFDLGRVHARVQRARAQTDAAAAVYQKTVLNALEETENALIQYARGRENMALLDDSRRASEHAAALARLRYQEGASDFLDELDAERTQLSAEDQFAQAQTQVATALVALYKALDGGWAIDGQPRQSVK